MTATELLSFLRQRSLAVQATVSADNVPQAAVVGIVVTNTFDVFFDCSGDSRKVANLRRNPRIAFVFGGTMPGDERTVQYEGIADQPTGAELARLKEHYFASFPDGRQRESWADITYIRARPTWIRYSDFNQDPPEIFEFDPEQLRTSGPKVG